MWKQGPLLGFIRIGRVAQAGERLVDIEEVTGSIPVAPTIISLVFQRLAMGPRSNSKDNFQACHTLVTVGDNIGASSQASRQMARSNSIIKRAAALSNFYL
jgi:hypothetical protein